MNKIKLTLSDGEQEWSAELLREPIKLDELTWEWLKGAFVAVGFSASNVDAFFDDEAKSEDKL